jgi:hypothetical protein
MIKETKYIDSKTGEIYSNKVSYINAAFNEEKGYLFWARKSFAKSFQEVPYPEGMSFVEIGQVAVLAKHIYSNTNMLGYRGNGGIRPYTTEGIAKILKVGRRRAQQFISKMTELGMIAKVEVETENKTETQLYINPIYFCSSNRIPLNLYLIFRKQLDEVLPDWVKKKFFEEQANERKT